MCGIAGLMALEGGSPDQAAVARMVDALAHRGPDGRGAYNAQDVAFAHNRLSIIDLKTGDQPFDDEAGAALIVNGEIYNYIELRALHPELNFTTKSDCETPLRLYPGDLGPTVGGVGANPGLSATEANRLVAVGSDGHRHQGT